MSTDYTRFLRLLLAPAGVYSWRDGSYSLADLAASGAALGILEGELDGSLTECMPDSAEGEGLALRSELFSFLPAGLPPSAARRAVSALMTVGDASFSRSALCAALAGCGLNASVRATDRAQTVLVEFPGTAGIPENFAAIRRVVEELLPAHVDIEYAFSYAPWTAWEARNPTWRSWDGRGESWRERETAV